IFAREPTNHFNRFLIGRFGRNRIGVTERHADKRGQRNYQIGFCDEWLYQFFFAAISAHDGKFFVLAAIHQRALVEIKIVEHGDFVTLREQRWSDDRTEITGAAGDEHFHFLFSMSFGLRVKKNKITDSKMATPMAAAVT